MKGTESMKHIKTTLAIVALAGMAMTATASNSHHSKHKSKKAVAHAKASEPVALDTATPEIRPMVGTWTLRNGDKPRTDIKMIFRPNGTFAFHGPNWQSAGTFRIAEHRVALEWTSVDGSKVTPGTMKKAYPM